MHRTNIYLDDEQIAALDAIARAEEISRAQVIRRIIDSATQKLGLPPEKVFVNIDKYGNTSAASIPIALDEAWRAGKIQKGDVLIFVAFGGGLTWANAVVRV